MIPSFWDWGRRPPWRAADKHVFWLRISTSFLWRVSLWVMCITGRQIGLLERGGIWMSQFWLEIFRAMIRLWKLWPLPCFPVVVFVLLFWKDNCQDKQYEEIIQTCIFLKMSHCLVFWTLLSIGYGLTRLLRG